MKNIALIIFAALLLLPNVAKAKTEYTDFLNTPCDAMQLAENSEKFKDLDFNKFIDWYLTNLSGTYPQYDVEQFKQNTMNYNPKEDTPDDMAPFFWLMMAACVEEDWQSDTLGQSLEQAVAYYLDNKPEYHMDLKKN